MAKYLLVYHGGSQPESEEAGKEVMGAWMGWMEKVGSSLADAGNPIGPSKTVASSGDVSDGGGANPATGYSLINADSLDGALAIAKGCPHLKYGGSVEVAELMEIM